jgi:hypothetical protein
VSGTDLKTPGESASESIPLLIDAEGPYRKHIVRRGAYGFGVTTAVLYSSGPLEAQASREISQTVL